MVVCWYLNKEKDYLICIKGEGDGVDKAVGQNESDSENVDEGVGKREGEDGGVDKAVGENESDSEKRGREVGSSLSRDFFEGI